MKLAANSCAREDEIVDQAPVRAGKERVRLVSPTRDAVDRGSFARPVFADFAAYRGLLESVDWPDLAALNARIDVAAHSRAGTGRPTLSGCEAGTAPAHVAPRFVTQTPALLADGLHYEVRIASGGGIPTREGNWHDLLNALVWLRHPALKRALNSRQVADIARTGPRTRTRGQCALTLFDEGGLIVFVRDARLIEAWDDHDWPRLFGELADSWRNDARVVVFGHALLEHALDPDRLLVGKALVVDASGGVPDAASERSWIEELAGKIAAGQVLRDPQELRPLPISGIPGWHDATRDLERRAAFLREGECFRPKAPGRVYPHAIGMIASHQHADPTARKFAQNAGNPRAHD